MKGIVPYKTATGRELKIEYNFNIISPEDVPTDKETFSQACKDGCKNYNKKWSCPPCSPDFKKMKHKKYLLLFLLKINGKDFSDCDEWMKVKAINAILKPKVDKIAKSIEHKFNGYAYISGACRICKECAKKTNDPCKYPSKLRYSLEAVGIDCNKLIENALNMKFCWYKKNEPYEYGAVIGGVELDDKIGSSKIENMILNLIKV
ncbi:MAG: DUF2284 domain-containing protein [Nanoarchaeota archaeon]|nr:DUF2284 domain-containing protein [Nanoarchaeota archaeon]MBU4123968.1 DUF2284 domain-containing protein [Nanoarchaeota archaeon]